MLIDTHSHIYFQNLRDDLAGVCARMAGSGVAGAVAVGIDAESNQLARAVCQLSKRQQMPVHLEYSAGLHPAERFGDAVLDVNGNFDAKEYLASHLEPEDGDRAIAIGECGIDLYWKINPLRQQETVFKAQLELGRELDLPVIVHTRDADLETLACIASVPGAFGVIHCFNGTQAMCDFITRDFSQGGRWYASFAGNLTLGSRKLESAAMNLPLERLMVETDAPFMAPKAARAGLARNEKPVCEPAHVRYTAECLAMLRELEIHQLEEILFSNTIACFGVHW